MERHWLPFLTGLFFIGIITLSNPVSAQRLMDANRSTIGYIEEGRVLNEYRSTIGYLERGRILNASRATLGYFEDGRVLNSGERIPSRLRRDGVSEQRNKEVLDGIGFLAGSAARSFNAYRATLGYVEKGRVMNANRSTLGYLEKGRVLNANRSTLGYYEGVIPEDAALFFFFFFGG